MKEKHNCDALRNSASPLQESIKNITEYSYASGHAFEGYRFMAQDKGMTFMKYFSAKKFGGKTKALTRAKAAKKAFHKHLMHAKRYRNGELMKSEVKALKKILADNS